MLALGAGALLGSSCLRPGEERAERDLEVGDAGGALLGHAPIMPQDGANA